MENTPQQVVGVAEQEKEDRDGQGRVDDAPLGQQALDQGWPPHQESKLLNFFSSLMFRSTVFMTGRTLVNQGRTYLSIEYTSNIK